MTFFFLINTIKDRGKIMKKTCLLVMPLMALSFLASCNNSTPWYKDTKYLSSLTKEDITKEGGTIKTLKVNGKEHKVRLIGVDEDYTDITKPDETKIHTTWEFVNLISDKNGFSLATQWNDTNITKTSVYNYKEASIRNALNGVNVKNVHWSEKEATSWSTTYNCSVLDMINAENKGFGDVLKKPIKLVSIYNEKKQPNPGFEDRVINDKLFLLSPREMGCSSPTQEEGSATYTYYEGHTETTDTIRIKKQVNESSIFDADMKVKIPYSEESGQLYENKVYNYGGHNPEESRGGIWWFRSPYTGQPELGHPYRCTSTGSCVVNAGANEASHNVAPAFCI